MGRPPGRSKTMCFSSRRLCGSSLCGRLLPRDSSAAGGGQGRRTPGGRGGDCRGGRTADTSRRPGKGEREGYFRASVGYRSGHSRAAPGGGAGEERRVGALGGEGG